MTPALREACRGAVHVITLRGQVLRGGRASLFVLRALGYRRSTCLLGLPPLVWAVELGYRVVASHRPFFARFLFRKEEG